MAKKVSPKRSVFRIQLTPKAKKVLDKATAQDGVSQIHVMSTLAEWFAGQPEMIRKAILGTYPEPIQQDVAKLILSRMADGVTGA